MNLRRAARIGTLGALAAGLAFGGLELMGNGPAGGTGGVPADRAAGNVVAADALAPSFTLPRLRGAGSLALRDLAGHVVVNFWASWCSACCDLPSWDEMR